MRRDGSLCAPSTPSLPSHRFLAWAVPHDLGHVPIPVLVPSVFFEPRYSLSGQTGEAEAAFVYLCLLFTLFGLLCSEDLSVPVIPAPRHDSTPDTLGSLVASLWSLILSAPCPQRDSFSSQSCPGYNISSPPKMIQVARTMTSVLTVRAQGLPCWGGPWLPPHREADVSEATGVSAPPSPLFEADCWPRSGAREGVAAFPTFVGSEKEDTQWWRGAWL